jgi:ABC-type lipoprotein release transport system permease subunit
LLPLDPTQGRYEVIIALTIIGSMLSSIIPAISASRTDPVKVIGQ